MKRRKFIYLLYPYYWLKVHLRAKKTRYGYEWKYYLNDIEYQIGYEMTLKRMARIKDYPKWEEPEPGIMLFDGKPGDVLDKSIFLEDIDA